VSEISKFPNRSWEKFLTGHSSTVTGETYFYDVLIGLELFWSVLTDRPTLILYTDCHGIFISPDNLFTSNEHRELDFFDMTFAIAFTCHWHGIGISISLPWHRYWHFIDMTLVLIFTYHWHGIGISLTWLGY